MSIELTELKKKEKPIGVYKYKFWAELHNLPPLNLECIRPCKDKLKPLNNRAKEKQRDAETRVLDMLEEEGFI